MRRLLTVLTAAVVMMVITVASNPEYEERRDHGMDEEEAHT